MKLRKADKARAMAVFTHKEVTQALYSQFPERFESAGIKSGMVSLEIDREIAAVVQDEGDRS